MKRIDSILAAIARDHLNIPTLQIHRSDNLDFHEVAVWTVKTALEAAFNAGRKSAGTLPSPAVKPSKKPVSGPLQPTLVVPQGTALIPSKMYLRLFHGRTDPNQDMEDWGFTGPTFGPLSSYTHTYCSTFRAYSEQDTSEVWLDTHGDMIRWDGCFYGDLDVFIANADDHA